MLPAKTEMFVDRPFLLSSRAAILQGFKRNHDLLRTAISKNRLETAGSRRAAKTMLLKRESPPSYT